MSSHLRFKLEDFALGLVSGALDACGNLALRDRLVREAHQPHGAAYTNGFDAWYDWNPRAIARRISQAVIDAAATLRGAA